MEDEMGAQNNSPTVRGSEDLALAGAVGNAIVAARGDMTQTELSAATGIDQPTISKLEKGMRKSPLTVWEMRAIEQATGRPPGFILTEVGYLHRRHGARQAIAAEPNLTVEGRRLVLATLDAAMGASAPRPSDDVTEALRTIAEHLGDKG
jgi:transcriptional regulator with XRE-family HTH domain